MLVLKNVVKDYQAGDEVVHALKGVSINFRKNEFVSILGPSGCGKTTMLNIIGGLDHYTKGDLIINGKSTATFKDRDWDVYRNHRIGFIFQSYNLIPHQTILGNVELALTIAGADKETRIKKAKQALDRVGLKGQYNKRPNQLSGGQCQRVAIARALVNDPEILLADEPTGALDSETSVQIMNLIKEISGERLVIMVTHNPELAKEYSTRIVRLLDGEIIEDTRPYSLDDEMKESREEPAAITAEKVGDEKAAGKKERAKMSFFTAFKLSARNLISKKGRTILVGIAGSIGIIGVAMVLAFSAGIKGYVKSMQDDMLSGNPVTITETSYDLNAINSLMSKEQKKEIVKQPNYAYVNGMVEYLAKTNDAAKAFFVKNEITQDYIDYVKDMPKDYYAAMKFGYGLDLNNNVYTDMKKTASGDSENISISALTSSYIKLLEQTRFKDNAKYVTALIPSFEQAPNSVDYIESQYDVTGKIATEKDEIMLVLDKNDELYDVLLARLGIYPQENFLNLIYKVDESHKKYYDESKEIKSFSFDELLDKTFTYYSNNQVYAKTDNPVKPFTYNFLGENVKGDGLELKIVGILQPKKDISYGCLTSGVYYTEKLTDYVLETEKESEIVKYVEGLDENDDVGNGLFTEQSLILGMYAGNLITFDYRYTYDKDESGNPVYVDYTGGVSFASSAGLTLSVGSSSKGLDYGEFKRGIIRAIGGNSLSNSVTIYPISFDNKDLVTNYLDKWNDDHAKITYTDTLSLIISLINTMINVVSYALVGFTSVSLVVSTVMIGIITYVSVVERIKEIGVIRSLGGRKKDVSHLFNAETFIIGLLSGAIGVGVTYLLSGIINAILESLTNIPNLAALPFYQALMMIALSVALTLISGLIPAKSAAKKDPVVALRTE